MKSTGIGWQGAENRFRSVFQTFGAMSLLIDPGLLRIVDANPALRKKLGYTFGELTSLHISNILPSRKLTDFIHGVSRDGHGRSNEFHFVTKAGHKFPCDLAALQIGDSGEDLIAINIQDSVAKGAVDGPIESDTLYRSLFNSIDEGFYLAEVIWDESGKAIDIHYLDENPAAIRMVGQAARGRLMSDLDPAYEQYWRDIFGHTARSREAQRHENYAAPIDTWFNYYVFKPEGITDDRTIAIIFQDITERKRRESNLAFLAEIADDMSHLSTVDEILETVGSKIGAFLKVKSCLFVDVDVERGEVYVLDSWNSSDVPSLRHQTIRLSDFIDEEFARANRFGDGVVVRDTGTDPRSRGGDYSSLGIGSFVTIPFHRNGVWTNYLAVTDSQPRDWLDGEVELFRELANRIFPRLERARAEANLRRSEERLHTAMNAGRIFSWEMNPATRELVWSENMESIIGFPLDSDVDKTFEMIHPEDRQPIVDAINESIDTGGVYASEYRLVHPDNGAVFWFHSQGEVTLETADREPRFVGITQNITVRKHAEAALRRSKEDLERLIDERTADLSRANIELHREMEERRRIEQARHELLRRLITSQEDERRRIARDMHDQIGNQLTALNFRISLLKQALEEQTQLQGQVEPLEIIGKQLDKEIDSLIWMVRPPEIEMLGLSEAVRSHANNWSEHSGIPIDLRTIGSVDESIGSETKSTLYRITQEALNNVAKHADAERVGIILEVRSDQISLIIEDDGHGFDIEEVRANNKGMGMLGMHERAALLDGTVEVESTPSTGTTVIIRIPNSRDVLSDP